MGFIALSRLRFGDGWIEPGQPVPVESGRNYALMAHHGDIVFVPEGDEHESGQPASPEVAREAEARITEERAHRDQAEAEALAVADREQRVAAYEEAQAAQAAARGQEAHADLSAMKRPELDEHAHGRGVENPEGLPNKQAVLDAILAKDEEARESESTEPAAETGE